MKLACADYSFPMLGHDAALALIRAMEFDGVNVALMGDRSHLRPEAIVQDIPGSASMLLARLKAFDLELANVFFIPWTDFETMAPNHPERSERIRAADLFRKMLEFATAANANTFTLLPGIHWPNEGWNTSLARAADELAWRVYEGRAKGIIVSIEPHVGSIVDTPAKTLELVDRCPGLQLSLDYTHFVFQGSLQHEIDQLVRHACHVDFRGAAVGRLQTRLSESAIDYDRVMDVLRDADFQGFVGVEYVWTPAEPGSAYDLTHTDNVSETILMRDLIRRNLARTEL